jgi:hypothetical protein
VKTYFISGHRDLTPIAFGERYGDRLAKIVCESKEEVSFVVGDCEGCDIMAQRHLQSMGAKFKVYHVSNTPMHAVEGADLVGGFKSDVDRDMAMTRASDADIAWIRLGKERSGTARNIERREMFDGIAGCSDADVLRDEANQFL